MTSIFGKECDEGGLFVVVMMIVMIEQDDASPYTTPDSSDKHDPSDVEGTRMCAWRIFFEASARLQGILENRLKRQFGLTLSDYNVLLALWESPHHALRMGELAQRVIFSPSRLTYITTHLERDGWIEKTSVKEDRRSSCACLTSQGEEVVKKANALHQGMIREYLLEGFNEEEIRDIVRIVQGFGDKLSKIRA